MSIFFRAVENVFTLFEVPKALQSKLLIPMLNERSKTLLAKLPKERLDDYQQVKNYLLREFRLSAEQYSDKFWSATKLPEETYKLFTSRVKNLLLYDLDSRKVDSKDDLVNLLVADRVKQTLSDPCLRHVLSAEGDDWFMPEKLANVIDTYVNSRLNMSRDMGRSDIIRSAPAVRAASTSRDLGGVNKVLNPQGQARSTTPANGDRSTKCWVCQQTGHRARDCEARQSAQYRGESRNSSFDSSTRQTQQTTRPKTNPSQAKINHIKVQCKEPAQCCFLGARLANPKPGIRIPSPEVYEEANAICHATELREAQAAQTPLFDFR